MGNPQPSANPISLDKRRGEVGMHAVQRLDVDGQRNERRISLSLSLCLRYSPASMESIARK